MNETTIAGVKGATAKIILIIESIIANPMANLGIETPEQLNVFKRMYLNFVYDLYCYIRLIQHLVTAQHPIGKGL